MNLLERTISYDQVVQWGGTSVYEERHVKKWFGGRAESTVADVLEIPTEASRGLWAIMREQVLPARLMHRVALELCRWFLDRLEQDGVYLDFRSRRVLEAKERWL